MCSPVDEPRSQLRRMAKLQAKSLLALARKRPRAKNSGDRTDWQQKPSRSPVHATRAFQLAFACGIFSACAWAWAVGHSAAPGGLLTSVSESVRDVMRGRRRGVPAWEADASAIREAVEAFQPRPYRPPFWARNAHMHTIASSGDFETRFLGDRAEMNYWRERWTTPDGDFIDIDWLPAETKAAGAEEEGEGEGQTGAEGEEGEEEDGDSSDDSSDDSAEDSLEEDLAAAVAGGGGGGAGGAGSLLQGAGGRELEEAAALAKATAGTSLGLGSPNHPTDIHQEDASWMRRRRPSSATASPGGGTGPDADAGAPSSGVAAGAGRDGGDGGGVAGAAASGSRSLVILVHGMEGSSTAPLTKRFARVHTQAGMDVAAMNLRGCSGEPSRNPIGYHLGFTEDLLFVVEEIHRRLPGTWDRIYLSGFSLGGNVITKFLGEQGERASQLGIYGAAVGCVPFNPKMGMEKLERDAVGRYIYTPSFMSLMVPKAQAYAAKYPERLSMEAADNIKTFSEFSEIVWESFGFDSGEAYFEHVNAAKYLSRVKVPLLVVNARDDPFIEASTLPEQEVAGDAPVRLVYHANGGHCGFLTGSGRTWGKWGRRGGGKNDKDAAKNEGTGGPNRKEGRWLPTELARFIHHIDTELHGAPTPDGAGESRARGGGAGAWPWVRARDWIWPRQPWARGGGVAWPVAGVPAL